MFEVSTQIFNIYFRVWIIFSRLVGNNIIWIYRKKSKRKRKKKKGETNLAQCLCVFYFITIVLFLFKISEILRSKKSN